MTTALKTAIQAAFKSVYDHDLDINEVKLEPTNPQFEGHYTFVVFPYLRVTRKRPEETAESIGAYVSKNLPAIASYNVVKGFLNFEIGDDFWLDFINDTASVEMLRKSVEDPQKIMVEYSSPNTNKPLHLGHVRNNLLGYSIAEILGYVGHTVTKVNLINDRGIHICKSMLAYKLFANGEEPSASFKGDHLVGKYYVQFDKAYKEELQQLQASGLTEEAAASQSSLMAQAREMLALWEQGDAETLALWNKLNNWVYEGFDRSYSRMGVDFDKFYKESETYLLGKQMVLKGLEDGLFYQKEDNSIWADLTEDGLDHKLLLRGDGTSVYMTQDIGTADLKYSDYGMNQSMYVVGNEQDYHFKVLKLILQKLEKPYADGVFHMSYGMVELPSGKLKTREGKVVDADDLMDEMHATAQARTEEQGKTEGMSDQELSELYEVLGLGALKYFLLKVDPTKRIVFNPEESIDFQGNTGTFIQYTFARCKSVLRNAETLEQGRPTSLESVEKDLVQHLFGFGDKMLEAAKLHSPSIVAQYLYETAKLYNSFYNQCSILKAETEASKSFRIRLTWLASEVIETCGKLLGMTMPAKM